MAQEFIFLSGGHEADSYLDKGFIVVHNPNPFTVRITREGANLRSQQWAAVSESDPSIDEEESRGNIHVMKKTVAAPKKKAKDAATEEVIEITSTAQEEISNDADEKKDNEVHQSE